MLLVVSYHSNESKQIKHAAKQQKGTAVDKCPGEGTVGPVSHEGTNLDKSTFSILPSLKSYLPTHHLS